MKLQKFSCLSGSLASVVALFLLSNVLPATGAMAQSAPAAPAVSLPSGPSAPFLVAPSFALAGAPTSVAMGDLNQDGKPDLVTADALTGKVTVFLGKGNGKFASGLEYATGSHPGVVAVADLNGDGHLDVIVGDEAKGTISVFSSNGASNGNSPLQLKQTVAAGIAAAYIAVGDFNGDGKMDLAVAARQGGSLALLLNDGKGGLQKPALSVLHKTPASLTTADFNNDGHADLALANTDGTVSILLGAGNGTFHSLPDISVGRGVLSSIVVGDFDHDGNVDLAVTQSGGKAMSVLLGKGNGGFGPAAHYTVGNNPISSLVTDLDGDGVADLVVINQGSNTYSVLSGNGDGTFKESLDYVVGNGPVAAVAGQFDVNGHVDLAVINPSSQSVSVPLGNGDGTFKAARSYLAGIEPRAVASADLNGDKLADLVVTNYCGSDAGCGKGGSVAVFLANSDGSYRLSNSYPVGAGPVSVALADVNGDKLTDIVVLNRGDKTVSVLLARGEGGFEQPYTFPVTDSPIAVAVGDFNKDGKIDLAVLGDCGAAQCSRPGSVEVLTGHGDGSFTSAFVYPTGFAPASIAVGDLNQDKNLDIVVANRCGADSSCKSTGTASVLMGGANGNFTAAKDIAVGASPSSIALSDMSGRGVLDLLVSSSTANTLGVLRGNGDGSFKTAVAYAIGNTPGSVTVADFDGDGKLDVAIANVADSTVSVLFGKGDGTLNSSLTLPVGTGPAAIGTVAGINGSHASLVTANGNTGAATPGTDFSVLSNIHPNVNGGGLTNVVVAFETAPPSPLNVDTAVTLTATVTPVPPGPPVPGQTATFLSNGMAIPDCGTAGTASLNGSGVAQCTTSSLLAGADSITATYSGDVHYASNNTSNTLSQTVAKVAPTVTVGFNFGSSSTSTYGDAVTFVATIGANGPVVPASGTVAFTDAGTPFTCDTEGALTAGTTSSTVTCTIASLAGGPHTIGATYTAGADLNFKDGASTATLGLTVNKVAPTVTVGLKSGSSNPSAFGSPVTFLATIAGVSGLAAPTGGTVTFVDGSTPITCTSPLVPSGSSATAACTDTALAGGTRTIKATYTTGTDPNYSTVTSAGFSQTVNTLATTTTLASSAPASSNVDDSVTFTATVTSTPTSTPAPGGTVSFTLNTAPIGSCQNVAKVGTTWTCTIQTLLAPADSIGATYNGDSNYAGSTAAKLAQSVNTIAANISMGSPAQSSVVNQAVTFTAKAIPAGVASPVIVPTGSIAFMQGGTTLCSGTLSGNPATASCSAIFSAIPGTNPATITPTYNGDRNFTVGTVGTATQTVNADGTTAAITLASPSGSNVNQAVVFSSSVTPTVFGSPNGTTVPKTGTMSIFDLSSATPTTPICTAPVNNGLVQSCSYAGFTTSGTHELSATFGSTDANFSSSAASSNFPYIVNTSGTSITPSASPTSSTVDQQVTLSAVLSFPSGSVAPQGTVTFTDTFVQPSVLVCSVTLNADGSVPVCPAKSFLVPGPHTIVVAYTPAAGSSFNPTSATTTINVSKGTPTVGLTMSPTPSTVDQIVTFTASITNTFAATGSSVPSGTVTFSYAPNGTTTQLCVATVNAAGTSASCTAPFLAATAPATPYTVTAAYGGDTNFVAASMTASQAVGQTSTTSSITSIVSASSAPISVNQEVIFTANVAKPAIDAGATQPTGTVTFTDSSATPAITLCKATLTSGTASCNGAFSAHGPRTVSAAYSGDTNFSAALVATASSTVQPAGTVAAIVSASPASPTVNQNVTFNATVTSSPVGFSNGVQSVAVVPASGTMTFTDNSTATSTVICTKSVTNGVVQPCVVPFGSAGTHNITATFTSADANFSPSSASANFPEVIGASSTNVVVTPFAGSTVVNTLVNFNSKVTSTASGNAIPTGSVAYLDGAKGPTLCTANLLPSGVVPSCSAPLPTAGTHIIEAVFTPSPTDTNFTAATSLSVNLTIAQDSPVVTINAPSPATFTTDQPVTYTVSIVQTPAGVANTGVAPNVPASFPSGTVTFSYAQAGGQPTVVSCVAGTSASPAPVAQGNATTASSATCSFPFPAAGNFTVNASYNGDTNFALVSQTTGTQIVGTTNGLVVSVSSPSAATSAVVNQRVNFEASVAKPSGDTGTTPPSGTITFYDTTSGTSVQLCAETLATTGAAAGTANCTGAFVNAGARTVSAVYTSSNTNFAGATSANVTPTVNANTASVTLTASPSINVATQSVIFTTVVQQTAPAGATLTGTAVPTGTVAFVSSDGALNNCGKVQLTPAASGTATAICAFSFRPSTSGTPSVTASYVTGDANFTSASGTASPAPTVENFCLAFAASDCSSAGTIAPVTLTVSQGNSNNTDPFTKTPLSVTSTSLSGFTDPVNLTCQVQAAANVAAPPTCAFLANTLSPGSLTTSVTVTAQPKTPVDQYTVIVSAADPRFPNLVHQTIETLLVNVVNTAGTLSLAVGSAATTSVEFNTPNPPAGTMFNPGGTTYACGTISPAPTSGSFTCGGPSSAVQATSPSTSISITIGVKGTTTASLRRPEGNGSVAMAAFWGVPLLALLAWVAQRKSPRRNFFRFLGMLLLILGFSYGIGCGGSFKAPPIPTGGPTPGNYLIQVIATDSTNTQHIAVVPVTVVASN